MIRKAVTLGIVTIVGGFMMVASSGTAQADLTRCVYKAYDRPSGDKIADGWSIAFSEKRACRRAYERCERELKRKKRRDKVGRGVVCRRVKNR